GGDGRPPRRDHRRGRPRRFARTRRDGAIARGEARCGVSVLGEVLSATMLGQTLRMAVPYACAALGGVWSERSGVVNIALEGMLLGSALAAVAAHHASSSATVGVLAAVVVGAAFAAVHAALFVWGRIDAIVSGVALNV